MKPERRQRGQAMVEAALFVPIVFLLLFGTYDLSTLASDKVQSYSAVRHGARIASQLGGVPKNPLYPTQVCSGVLAPGTPVAGIDAQIVQVVLASTANMSYVTVNEIDIYQPASANGTYQVGSDHANRYDRLGVLQGAGEQPIVGQGQAGRTPRRQHDAAQPGEALAEGAPRAEQPVPTEEQRGREHQAGGDAGGGDQHQRREREQEVERARQGTPAQIRRRVAGAGRLSLQHRPTRQQAPARRAG